MDFSIVSLAAKYATETLRADGRADVADIEIMASWKQDLGPVAYDVILMPHNHPGPRTIIATVWA